MQSYILVMFYGPDFDEQQLQAAIQWFNQRQRRFGKIGEQIEEQDV